MVACAHAWVLAERTAPRLSPRVFFLLALGVAEDGITHHPPTHRDEVPPLLMPHFPSVSKVPGVALADGRRGARPFETNPTAKTHTIFTPPFCHPPPPPHAHSHTAGTSNPSLPPLSLTCTGSHSPLLADASDPSATYGSSAGPSFHYATLPFSVYTPAHQTSPFLHTILHPLQNGRSVNG